MLNQELQQIEEYIRNNEIARLVCIKGNEIGVWYLGSVG